ncbi:hypothetical protein Vafri_10744 [Volvox africanus]|uniref:Uncharacterized protein n=1 Tax=Volvox africanus TaxID=51714 RepID=A0A8J4F2M7_9CHLO|nr:hypothetical protein Vafri_10744 [Volvox africanus]
MEGRPRSAVRTASAVAVVSASTEFLERGAMVGAGQYGVTKNASFGTNALSPLMLPQQPAATSALTSPAAPTPGPPTATAADLHAMVIALDESRDFHSVSAAPSPTAPPSPSPLSSHSPQPCTPRSPGPLASSSPTLDLEPTPGSLKLFCSGTVGEIGRSPSPGPGTRSGSRASLTLIPKGVRANSPSMNTPTARHAAGAFPLSIDVGATATTAAHSGASSPQRQQGWLESVYSPKSPSNGCSGPGPGSPHGAGTGIMGPDASPAVRSPMGSPSRQRGTGTPGPVTPGSSSSPGRASVSRGAISLQSVYSPTPPPPPVLVVASADADWSNINTAGGDYSGDGATVANDISAKGDTVTTDPLPVKEGLRAYYLLSPASPSAAGRPATSSPVRGSNPGSSPERIGSPRRAGPVGVTAATLPQKFPSMSAAHQAATSSLGRQPSAAPIAQASRSDVASNAAMSNGSLTTLTSSAENLRQPSAPAPPRADGGHYERPAAPAADLGQGPVPGPGPGSAALAAGRVSPADGRVSTAWSSRGRSPYAAVAAAAQGPGPGPFRSSAGSASGGSPAGSPSPTPPPQQQQQHQQQVSDRRAARREELFEEQDPAVVLEQSIALLSVIEGHIRESVGLPADHPLQSIDPDLAQDIPLQLVEALEDTLEVIAMAREELAKNRVGDPGRDRSRDRERDRDRDRDQGPRPTAYGPGTPMSPYAQYRSIGGGSSAGGARGRVSRTGSQPGNGNGLSSGGGSNGTSRPPRGSWAGGSGSSSFGGAGPTHGGSSGSHLPPIGGGSSGGGGRSGASFYGRPPSQQHSSRPSSRQQHPHPHSQPPQPPRSSSISRRTSGSLSGGGGAGAGGGSTTSIPSLAATVSSRRAWHREPPPEEWVAAKQARADSERRNREAQLAADLRYLQQIRGRASEVQQTHEALLAQAEESVRAARSAKASTEAQHRWLQYQETVAEGAKRHYENLMAQQQGSPHVHDGACGPTRYRVY